MNNHHRFVLPSILVAAAVMLGGCIGTEPDDDLEESMEEAEPTTQDGEALQQVSAASYNGVCGSGYAVIDSHALTGGTVYLAYNRSTGYNCVVTIRNTSGTRISMNAKVSRAGQPWISDPGQFTTYAGPVKVHAPHACIDWGGEIGTSKFYEYNSHCS